MAEPKTICFVADTELEVMLKTWAAEDDRTVSAVLRQMIKSEQIRRRQLSLAGFPQEDQTEEQPAAQMKRAGVGSLLEVSEVA